MAFSLVKSTIDYSIKARRQLAESPDNPYKKYVVPDFELADFVLNVDEFLHDKLPPELKDALSKVSLKFPGEQPINLLFYFRLGNNFLNLKSADDPKFKSHPLLFPDVPCDVESAYESLISNLRKDIVLPPEQNKLEIILSKLVPYFAILGPLDYGFNKNLNAESRRTQAMFQVEHSHRKRDSSYHLNMPAPYYALVSRARETVYICLDSCTFMIDLEQQRWLLRIYVQARELFPSYKFNILSYHGLRYVPSPSQQPLDDAQLASEWTQYQQQAYRELTSVPSIIIGEKTVLACQPKGSQLGLNGTIGAGLELFLRLHNIIISAICSSNLGISKIDRFDIRYTKGEFPITQYYFSYNDRWTGEYSYKHLYMPTPHSAASRFSLDLSLLGNKFFRWAAWRAELNLLLSRRWNNPPLDLSLLTRPDAWQLNDPPHDPPHDPQEIVRLSGLSQQELYQHLGAILDRSLDGLAVPAQCYKTIAMLFDPRYNPAFLAYALLKQHLDAKGLYILNSHSPDKPNWLQHFSLELMGANRISFTMGFSCDYIFNPAVRSAPLAPIEVEGRGRNPLEIKIGFELDLYTGEIVPHALMEGACCFYSPYPQIQEVLHELDNLNLAAQAARVDSLMRNYLYRPDSSGQPGRYEPQRTMIDIFNLGQRFDLPIDRILPHSSTSYVRDCVERYKNDEEYKQSVDRQSNLDLNRSIVIPGRVRAENQFPNLDALIECAGADFLDADQRILLRLLISQNFSFNLLFGLYTLYHKYEQKHNLSLRIQKGGNTPGRWGVFLVDPLRRTCSIVWQYPFSKLVVLVSDLFDDPKQFNYPFLNFFIESRITLDPPAFIKQAFYTTSSELRKELEVRGCPNLYQEATEYLSHNFEKNLEVIRIKKENVGGQDVYQEI